MILRTVSQAANDSETYIHRADRTYYIHGELHENISAVRVNSDEERLCNLIVYKLFALLDEKELS